MRNKWNKIGCVYQARKPRFRVEVLGTYEVSTLKGTVHLVLPGVREFATRKEAEHFHTRVSKHTTVGSIEPVEYPSKKKVAA